MSTPTTTDLAESVILALKGHEAELRRAGIRHLSLFGSVARGHPDADSDVDLAADCLTDIVENSERIEAYLEGMDYQTFERDGRTRDAVELYLERMCEAAHRLGEQAATLMPGQLWADIRGMRNRLRHAYDLMDQNVVWNTVRHRHPALAIDARHALVRIGGDEPRGSSHET